MHDRVLGAILLVMLVVPAEAQNGSDLQASEHDRWGAWADLAGTWWLREDGSIDRYRWSEDGEVLIQTLTSENSTTTRRIVPGTADGTLDYSIDNSPTSMSIAMPQRGYAIVTNPKFKVTREVLRFTPDLITRELQTFENGEWLRAEATERRRIEPTRAIALAQAIEERRPALRQSAWGPLQGLAGTVWHGPGTIYTFEQDGPDALIRYSVLTDETVTYRMGSDGRLTMTSISNQQGPQWSYSGEMVAAREDALTATAVMVIDDKRYGVETDLSRSGDVLIERIKYAFNNQKNEVVLKRLSRDELSDLRSQMEMIATPQAIAKNWGVMAELIGRSWVSDYAGSAAVSSYEWLEKGLTIVRTTGYVTSDAKVYKPGKSVLGIDLVSHVWSDGTKVMSDGSYETPSPLLNGVTVTSKKDQNSFKQIHYSVRGDGRREKFVTTKAHAADTSVATLVKRYAGRQEAKIARKKSGEGSFMAALSGAIMGAATGYADSGGSSVGAITGAMGGAMVGKAGGNGALYQQMEATRAQATADAEASQRQLQRTIAQARRQGGDRASGGSGSSSGASGSGPLASTPASGTAAAGGVAPAARAWTVDVWCLSSQSKRWKEQETLGSRTIEVDHGKVTMYKSQVFPMTITDLGQVVDGASAKWRAYLTARQLPFDKAGCENGRGQFDRYVVGVEGSGQSVTEVIQTDFRM